MRHRTMTASFADALIGYKQERTLQVAAYRLIHRLHPIHIEISVIR